MARAGFPKANRLFEASEDKEKAVSEVWGSFLWIGLRTSTHLSSVTSTSPWVPITRKTP